MQVVVFYRVQELNFGISLITDAANDWLLNSVDLRERLNQIIPVFILTCTCGLPKSDNLQEAQ